MELNAEQIKKALGCCIEGECDGCTYDEQTACKEYILHDALALITSQEQRIKELTEAVERSETARGRKESIDNGFSPSVTELQRENERLRADCVKGANALIEEMQRNRTIKAVTVRKMQEALEQRIHSKLSYHGWYLKETVIPEIVKEMLEGKK